MRLLETSAPAAAIVAALATHVCCLPLGFLGALGFTGVGVWMQPLRLWFLGASVILLCLGFVRLYFRRSACVRRGATSLTLFWAAVVVVLLTIVFPQVISSLITG
jgi:hypothetical protein